MDGDNNMKTKLTQLTKSGKLETFYVFLPEGAELFDGPTGTIMSYNGKSATIQQWINSGNLRVSHNQASKPA